MNFGLPFLGTEAQFLAAGKLHFPSTLRRRDDLDHGVHVHGVLDVFHFMSVTQRMVRLPDDLLKAPRN